MIRIAKKEDINVINNMGSLYYPNFINTYNIDDYIKNSNYLILVNEELNINAFLIVLKTFDTWEIELIYVNEKDRKKGIGTKLLDYFFNNYPKQNSQIFLEVSVENNNAINLYKKMGFNIISIRKKYYNCIDAYIMKKIIS